MCSDDPDPDQVQQVRCGFCWMTVIQCELELGIIFVAFEAAVAAGSYGAFEHVCTIAGICTSSRMIKPQDIQAAISHLIQHHFA